MRELHADAQGGTARQCALAPAGFFSDQVQHAAHALGLEVLVVGRTHASAAQQIQAELHRVLLGGVRQLVDERLEDEAERVAARRAHALRWECRTA